ncbi:hypothetical protein AB4259_00705, partial [Vibrio amylolyticus]|uniref:hypothetical protein n=1 Tax=Vibrio amylolyticus TaxID=2847292 RepID=UPI0035525452
GTLGLKFDRLGKVSGYSHLLKRYVVEVNMNKELSNTINEVVAFTNLHKIDATFQINTVVSLKDGGDLQNDRWAQFEKKAGVYLLIPAVESDNEGVYYIGMSEKCVGGRVHQWLTKKNKVNDVIEPEDIVLTISLSEQPYMSPALESYLINKLVTRLNVMKTT